MMSLGAGFLTSRREGIAPVPRHVLRHLHLALPPLGARRLVDAVALQLTQHMPSLPFAFVCRREPAGEVTVWVWTIADGHAAAAWPEPLLDATMNDGPRLLRRSQGYEAQRWQQQRLTHSEWLPSLPDDGEWGAFVRATGLDLQEHPLPAAMELGVATARPTGWLRANNLPRPDPWRGWRWQAAGLTIGCVLSAAVGIHAQTLHQLAGDRKTLAELRSERNASMQARTRHEASRAELEALLALAPTLSQLYLLDRVVASGLFDATAAPASEPPTLAPQATGVMAARTGPSLPTLVEWDIRGLQLRLTLELPEGDYGLLDRTRRLEQVSGLYGLKVGQESTANTMVLSATLAPPTPAVR